MSKQIAFIVLLVLALGAYHSAEQGDSEVLAAQPSHLLSDGTQGDLRPVSSVEFRTNEGEYRVDGGPWVAAGRLNSHDEPVHAPICIYNFREIELVPEVQIRAEGR